MAYQLRHRTLLGLLWQVEALLAMVAMVATTIAMTMMTTRQGFSDHKLGVACLETSQLQSCMANLVAYDAPAGTSGGACRRGQASNTGRQGQGRVVVDVDPNACLNVIAVCRCDTHGSQKSVALCFLLQALCVEGPCPCMSLHEKGFLV